MFPSITPFALAPMASLWSMLVSQSVQRMLPDNTPSTSLLPRSILFPIRPGKPEDVAASPKRASHGFGLTSNEISTAEVAKILDSSSLKRSPTTFNFPVPP